MAEINWSAGIGTFNRSKTECREERNMKETCCDFCGREKNHDELIPFGQAKICRVCKEEQKNKYNYGKVVKGGLFNNSKLSK